MTSRFGSDASCFRNLPPAGLGQYRLSGPNRARPERG